MRRVGAALAALMACCSPFGASDSAGDASAPDVATPTDGGIPLSGGRPCPPGTFASFCDDFDDALDLPRFYKVVKNGNNATASLVNDGLSAPRAVKFSLDTSLKDDFHRLRLETQEKPSSVRVDVSLRFLKQLPVAPVDLFSIVDKNGSVVTFSYDGSKYKSSTFAVKIDPSTSAGKWIRWTLLTDGASMTLSMDGMPLGTVTLAEHHTLEDFAFAFGLGASQPGQNVDVEYDDIAVLLLR